MNDLEKAILLRLSDGEADFEQIYLYVNFDQNDDVFTHRRTGSPFWQIMEALEALSARGVIVSRLHPTYPKDFGPLLHHYRLRE